jgi:hypothetical protein
MIYRKTLCGITFQENSDTVLVGDGSVSQKIGQLVPLLKDNEDGVWNLKDYCIPYMLRDASAGP